MSERDYDDVKADRSVAAHDSEADPIGDELHGNWFAVYRMPEGDWGARVPGIVTDGFENREGALVWVANRLAFQLSEALTVPNP